MTLRQTPSHNFENPLHVNRFWDLGSTQARGMFTCLLVEYKASVRGPAKSVFLTTSAADRLASIAATCSYRCRTLIQCGLLREQDRSKEFSTFSRTCIPQVCNFLTSSMYGCPLSGTMKSEPQTLLPQQEHK